MKLKYIAAGAVLTLILAGCGNGNETAPKAGDTHSNSTGSHTGHTGAETISAIEHMHGMAYSVDGAALMIATHEGLVGTHDKTAWNKFGKENIDLMGFNVLPDGTLMTSGHPGKGSKLPNPVGYMTSNDFGETWKVHSMQGQIDFHILTANSKQPNVVYGLNQMGEGKYGAGIYKSIDGGKKWEQIKPKGLPADLHKVLTMMSLPENPDVLLAGVEETGVMRSEDGGKTWKIADDTKLLTSMQSVPNSSDIIAYGLTNNGNGVMRSKDGGKNWEKLGLDLGQDAVAYLSINPKDPSEMAAASFENSVYLSKDGGKTWNSIMDKGKPKK